MGRVRPLTMVCSLKPGGRVAAPAGTAAPSSTAAQAQTVDSDRENTGT